MPIYTYDMVQLATLLVEETKAAIYKTAIGVATAVGLPTSSWQPGDPTRSLFHLESEVLVVLEKVVVGYIRSGFLEYAAELAASGDPKDTAWLKVLAKQVFNVDVPSPAYASGTIILTNNGGGLYEDLAAGDITFRSSINDKTYRNTSGGTLASGPGTTLTVDFVADEAGSDSSAGPGEINELITGLLGVTCTNPLAAVGTDEQDPSVTVQQCKDKLSALSPNGPRGILRVRREERGADRDHRHHACAGVRRLGHGGRDGVPRGPKRRGDRG